VGVDPAAEAPEQARATVLGPLLRRIRRCADLSQRELARALGVSAGTVAQAETGARDLPATILARAAELAGLRLALVDDTGGEVPGMAPAAVLDQAGRRFPAHLDTRYGDQAWWHGDHRYGRRQPWYTYDRRRDRRDELRTADGTPPDHQQPRAGDAPDERAAARRRDALARRRAADDLLLAEFRERGCPDAWAPTCSCPAECDQLLFPTGPLPAGQNAVPHVEACSCRCDVA